MRLFQIAIQQARARYPESQRPVVRFVVIVDRRASPQSIAETVRLAIDCDRNRDWVVGLDLAGDERQTKPKQVAELFAPAFEACLAVTIHAGEGQAASHIWQAAYHLHADRIGHGLTLLEGQSRLDQRFRDRGICLELCPTSNREVVGFFDPDHANDGTLPRYPLLPIWREGLALTVCTDNPGISRTTLADEFLAVARMSDGELTLWEILAMIKQGFMQPFSAARRVSN